MAAVAAGKHKAANKLRGKFGMGRVAPMPGRMPVHWTQSASSVLRKVGCTVRSPQIAPCSCSQGRVRRKAEKAAAADAAAGLVAVVPVVPAEWVGDAAAADAALAGLQALLAADDEGGGFVGGRGGGPCYCGAGRCRLVVGVDTEWEAGGGVALVQARFAGRYPPPFSKEACDRHRPAHSS